MKQFKSKRNEVLLKSGRIIKRFVQEDDYILEYKAYRMLENHPDIKRPKLLSHDKKNKVLELSFIEGVTVLDKLESLETVGEIKPATDVLVGVCSWLENFNKVCPNYRFGDVNLRNFIWSDGEVYGIDFECVKQCFDHGLRSDIPELLARFLLYRPEETDFKYHVVTSLQGILACGDERDKELLKEKMNTIKVRRKLENSSLNDRFN